MTPTIPQLVEVYRLAVAGGEAGIAREVGARVGRVLLARSRFADVMRLAESTLSLGLDASALYHLGWALLATGSPATALASYEQALDLYRSGGGRRNEAPAPNNIGGLYDGLGDRAQAPAYYQLALPIARGVGNRSGEAAMRSTLP